MSGNNGCPNDEGYEDGYREGVAREWARVVEWLMDRAAHWFSVACKNDGVNDTVATRCSKAGSVLSDEAAAIRNGEHERSETR